MRRYGPIRKRFFKKCEQCGAVMEKYPYESKPNFDKKRFCNHSCDATYKHSQSNFGNTGRTRFKKGCVTWNTGMKGLGLMLPAWNKGKKMSDEFCKKISISHKGLLTKEKNPAWKGGTQTLDHMERVKFRKQIQKKVLQRDNYTCQICGERGGDLQVDHIQSWAEYVELRFCIDNCRTLCVKCHYKITFGKPLPPTVRAWGHNLMGGTKL